MTMTDQTQRDEPDASTAYIAEQFQAPGSFEFESAIVDGFDDHVQSTIPFYNEVGSLVCGLSDWLAPSGATVADLGSGTGSTAHAIASRHPHRTLNFHLYDSAEAMLEAARRKTSGTSNRFYYHDTRLQDGLAHTDASLTLALFILQFLDPKDRMTLLRRARKRSRAGGALIVAEKLRLSDARWQEIAISTLNDYKAASGISPAAIANKERSIRGVLMTMTDKQQRQMLADTGWTGIDVLFRWHQWVVYAAFKSDSI